MNSKRSQEIDEIFQAALDLPSDQRLAYLDRACASDEHLRDEVESLISSYEQAGSFIEQPAIEVDASVVAAPMTSVMAGESIGHYRIIEPLDIASQVAGGTTAADEPGIIHRDIKPENVMLRRDGYAKVLDFGLAKLTERPAITADTQVPTRVNVKTDPGIVMGTANYMSPEQARGLKVDARTDIWSLGVVLYEMIAGRVHFEGETPSDVISLILQKEAPPLARCAPETPAELQRIVHKSLTKNRDERYQTVKDLLIDLRRLNKRLDFEDELQRS